HSRRKLNARCSVRCPQRIRLNALVHCSVDSARDSATSNAGTVRRVRQEAVVKISCRIIFAALCRSQLREAKHVSQSQNVLKSQPAAKCCERTLRDAIWCPPKMRSANGG